MTKKLFLALACLSILAGAFSSRLAAQSLVNDWNETTLQAIRTTKPGPPMVSRMLAVVHTAVYDAWAAYDPVAVGTQLGGSLRRPASEATLANKQKAVSYAAYRALVDLFPQPASLALFNAKMTALGYDPTDTSLDPATPAGVGNRAAAAVIAYRHTDGSNQLGDLNPGAYSDYTGYTPVNTPDTLIDANHWQPLRISDGKGGFVVQKFVAPHWFKVKPFALKSAAQFRPGAPAQVGSDEYVEQAEEVLAYSANLTDQQKIIAEYWADGPASELPPGHWSLLSQFVSHRDHYSLDSDVKLFFAVTNAIFDAGIAAWEAKRFYDYIRPVCAINGLFTGTMVNAWAGPGLGTRSIDGGTWRPYQPVTFVTPPFPEYVSGHSLFSAAGAEVLRQFTGSDVFGFSVTFPAGSSRVEPGLVPAQPLTLSWATFSDAADEAGISRRYGGIHFKQGDLASRQMGRLVGAQAYAKALTYFNPRRLPKTHRIHEEIEELDRLNQRTSRETQQLDHQLSALDSP